MVLEGISQQPVLSVKSFEYIYEKTNGTSVSPAKSRIIIASEDSAKKYIENAFAAAFRERWKLEVPELPLSVKPLGILSYSPKFKTRIKEKQANTWYFFLQIFDQRPLSLVSADNHDRRVSMLELKCRLIDGNTDSMISDRTFVTEIYEQPPPPDQAILSNLPGYPRYFIQTFDSIAKWVFQPEEPGNKKIRLKPACVYTGSAPPPGQIAELLFGSNTDSIHHSTQPSFLFKISGPGRKKIGARRNRGGNTASGVVTLFTGVELDKSRVFEYTADYAFEEGDSTFHCILSYDETETAERTREKARNTDGSKSYSVSSGSYGLAARSIDPTSINTIIVGNDTLATFRILDLTRSIDREKFTQFWDGSDSVTIAPLPNDWNYPSEKENVSISGKMGDLTFSMKTVKGMNVKEFYVDDKLVMILYGRLTPVKALLFHPVSVRQLKIFTMLASLPYPHFI